MIDLPAAGRLVDWLLWQSIYASVAAAIVFSLIRILRIRDPRWLLGLWTIVLLRFLLPVNLALPWSLGSLWDQFGAPVFNRGAEITPLPSSAPPVHFLGLTDQPIRSGKLKSLITVIWASGVLGMFSVMVQQHLQAYRVLKRALPAEPDAQDRLNHWRQIFGVHRQVRFVVGEAVLLPFTTGLLVPSIYVSRGHLAAMSAESLDAVLAHELAHVKSIDVAWLCLERAVQLLFFFHPVAWCAVHQLHQARERRCDIHAVKTSGLKAAQYWSSVLNLVQGEVDTAPRLAFASSLGRSARSLKARIDAVHHYSQGGRNSRFATYAGIATFSLFLLPLTPVARPAAISASPATATASQSQRSSQKTGLDRVVAARARLERYRNGDFDGRVIIRAGSGTLCAPGSKPKGVTCDGIFSRKDVGQLIWEAEDDLAKAERAVATPL